MNTARRMVLVLLAIAMALPAALGAQTAQATQGWTPELSMRYRGVGGVAMSPDGRLVAYAVREAMMDGEQSEFVTQVWLASADGSRDVQFTRGEKSASNPSFSPDGKLLAFTSARSGKNQVWVMPLDGGEAEQVTDADPGVGAYRWSPDGNRIAWTMSDPKSEEEQKADKEKRDVILVDQNFKNAHLHVQPLAKDTAGKREATRLTEGAFSVTGFDWVPDGSAIVFAHQPDPRINTSELAGDISVVRIADRSVTPLVTGPGVESSPLVSPDGSTAAFLSTGPKIEPIGLGDVWLVRLSGGAPWSLAETPDRSPSLLAWSPDGREIRFTESVHTDRRLMALPADGGPPRAISQGDGVIGAVDFARDGEHVAFTFETPDTPADVNIGTVSNFAPRRITDVSAGVPRPPMGRTELISWTSKDGKYPIEGLLTYPVNYRPGTRVPLVLNVHGGPAGVFSKSFTGGISLYMIQVFAQQGYAVLRPNPRGSTGYGKDFRYANFRDWGYGDFDDLMAGVDRTIALGVAHPDSLLLMGWSYGGYMTSFAVTKTDRFKAASMGAGLPNLISMTTTTDIGDYLVAHMGAEFWDDYATYEKHSAMYRIRNVTTPTQVMHGAQDLRVPFTQGQEFYRALGRRGVPTEMVVYPRTPHGPQEPKLLMDVTPRILGWFEKNLRPGRTTTDGR
jgi:dipeptidyl aminopeptidase/acylaminoacyl peptidase